MLRNLGLPKIMNEPTKHLCVVTVVVTYNRLPMLQRNIDCLRANKPITQIVVIDNGSTDGTAQWLDSQPDLKVVHQNNVGGSGGFYTGIERAMDYNPDWVWCMDDDVYPHPDCLEQMLAHAHDSKTGILAPRRLMEGKVYSNDFKSLNLTNPFKSLYNEKGCTRNTSIPMEIAGTAFEGPLFRAEVVKQIGLPNKDLFIFCDDTDYCHRAVLQGWKILYVPQALMDKHKFFSTDNWTQRNLKKKWKRFYQVRNSAYLNHRYGLNWGVRYLRGFIAVLGMICTAFFTAPFAKAWHWSDIPKLWRAYKDGINERLGKYQQ